MCLEPYSLCHANYDTNLVQRAMEHYQAVPGDEDIVPSAGKGKGREETREEVRSTQRRLSIQSQIADPHLQIEPQPTNQPFASSTVKRYTSRTSQTATQYQSILAHLLSAAWAYSQQNLSPKTRISSSNVRYGASRQSKTKLLWRMRTIF